MQKLHSYLNGKRHIIWDWNGTLLDDTDIAVHAVSKLLQKRNLPAIPVEQYRKVFGFPIKAYYERIGLSTDDHSLSELSDEFHLHYNSNLDGCKLHRGVAETLVRVKSSGVRQSILSAAQQDWLVGLLKEFDIAHHFDDVYGLTDFLANSKLERGKQLIAHSRIDPRETILIGDTDHDVEVAKELGIDVVIYADGHQAPELFSRFDIPVLRRS